MKKVAIIGTHGVGKTTLCKALAEVAKDHGKQTECVGEVVRECPYLLNHNMGYEALEWTSLEQIARERKAERANPDLIICDRSVYDPYVYFKQTFSASRTSVQHDILSSSLRVFLFHYLQTYDKIFLVGRTSAVIEDDGFRDLDKKFHREVDEAFQQMFHGKRNATKLDSEYYEEVAYSDVYVDSCQIFHNTNGLAEELYECIF